LLTPVIYISHTYRTYAIIFAITRASIKGLWLSLKNSLLTIKHLLANIKGSSLSIKKSLMNSNGSLANIKGSSLSIKKSLTNSNGSLTNIESSLANIKDSLVIIKCVLFQIMPIALMVYSKHQCFSTDLSKAEVIRICVN
jgi:hypothetical protein